uniref:N/A n=1 Tax=Ganoderma boninense TaxID=34458 RepID=A0A5K1K5G2_9APHY|nr:N/A [Ganoderma boninense]
MTLDRVRLFLSVPESFFLAQYAGMKNRIQNHHRASTAALSNSNIPETPHVGPRRDNSFQTTNVEDKGHEMDRLREKERRASQFAHSVKIKLETTTRRLEKADADLVASKHWAQQMEARLHNAERHAEETIAQLSRELRRCQSELGMKAALLDTRSAELRNAQAYLTLLDDVTDTEVLQLVNGINSRIFQVAANIAGAFQQRYRNQKDVQASKEAVTRLQAFLDSNLLLALNTVHHADDPLVVQTALQAILASCAGWLCATWNDHDDCPLQYIYQAIRETGPYAQTMGPKFLLMNLWSEPQSIAGRWRALSRTYVKTFLTDDKDRQRFETDRVLDCFTDILLISGVGVQQHDLRMEIEHEYADRLREVIHTSHEVQRITGERVISRDLLTVVVKPNESFNPSRMVDEWADPKRARHGHKPRPVVCTTQLGLVREERRTAERAGGEMGIVEVFLLKPKVVLRSLLEELSIEQHRGPCKT